MIEFSGPGYTLQEACEILKLRHSELAQMIRSGDIVPVVYTKPRPMILLYGSQDGHKFHPAGNKWVALGTFYYRGHVQIGNVAINSLMDGDPVFTQRDELKILEVNGISGWESKYPYKHPLPFDNIAGWRPTDFPGELALRLKSIPLPAEMLPMTVGLKNLIASIAALREGKDSAAEISALTQPKPEDMGLNFRENSEFHPADLRIPKSEIGKYQEVIAIKSVRRVPQEAKIEGTRENQLHTLIGRILVSSPDITAKEIWSVLEKECLLEERHLDCDYILQAVDTTEIRWRSRYGKDQSLRFDSFPKTVTRARGKLTLPPPIKSQ